MSIRLIQLFCLSLACAIATPLIAQDTFNTIEIRTRFSSFIGKPTWLLTLRDVDAGVSYPYLFDIKRGENYWVIPAPGYHYLITVSNMRINSYDAFNNQYKTYEINDFCQIESAGRIIHGQSMLISIDGQLSKNSNGYRCQIQKW